ncbi:16S rRNA (cytidine(1402)-2'-O)-methyltransferase [Agrobacterium sp. SHOUNA12C]|uniref:Ribosomal RNA small subunit methyltransferase I n=2 Tax=Rhizobium rhizogenes TaxID=359 RepID=B9J7N2_RHIR8|nr:MULTISPECIES: 16S rRNA (cytidine(1402)-2'-O)-methyltransferase [Rhizobium]ACM25204.1 methyltransferase protein [Rhizobium rhizogenes K84]KAA6487051.1 16S rRNA (cytidine(1402)-2'-O)-methyltransferase [Agrobacterium sp. ICMP 7243]MCJ9761109.1 16S rRNA (cytidine(1402)-2'-O)-methyltransferase [Agrobacterium sp. SHOUNA12C]OCI97834.1 16S rRNA (cytidine(1402)-2'-O)-methyltransferase [Agrobacterium sp. 13-626]OCJ21558.1 16S rRNA (cytidine(1402)-2'-O)-methyltransferase [Agrobacterium sp. B131/95]OC
MNEDHSSGGARSFRLHNHTVPARPLEPALYLVATPIGNLGDITLRALETLAGADVLACEDTRVTRVLLDRYGIQNRPYAYHEYNADEVGPRLLQALEAGRSVALVSDAGTPLVSDPGYRLAQQAIEAGYRVVPIPGASAPLAALVGSGLPNDAFLFAGFLPTKDKGKRDRLAELATVPATLIFFESPHRIAATLAAAADVLGAERPAAVGRELTKTFEEFRRGTLAELAAFYETVDNVKGEIVWLAGPPQEVITPEADIEAMLRDLSKTMPTAKAAAEAARLTGLPRKDLYQRLLDMKAQHE